jgi:error-prone DNA polymerase
MTPFAELCVATNFSFLHGGSHPEELVRQAAELGLAGIAVADRNSLAGVVRGHVMAKEIGLRYAVGCRLVFRDGTPDILVWPTDRIAYGRLCRLLSAGNFRAEKGHCHLDLADLLEWGEGLMLGVFDRSTAGPGESGEDRRLPAGNGWDEAGDGHGRGTPPPEKGRWEGVVSTTAGIGASPLAVSLAAIRDAFPDALRLMVTRPHDSADHRRLDRLARIGRHYGVPLLATGDVLYHHPDRRPLQDVLTCIREKTTLAAAGRRLAANAERHLKPAEEMLRLFRDCPEAVAESAAVLERLRFCLDELAYQYPDEPTGDAASPQEALATLAAAGAAWRYPGGVPGKILRNLDHELDLIGRLNYAPYFLTVHDIMRFARSKGILCQGRGSAANSSVCFCLGITEVDPAGESGGLFERFISENRGEPPDIDVDFEHERREEVMQYIYEKYGRHRTALAATVITYRTRSAIRDVGKVFGLSEDAVGALASTTWGWSSDGVAESEVRRAGMDPAEPAMRQVLRLCRELIGFPRHLSQHVGGFVITRDRLDEMMPVMLAAMEDRSTVEWDKDDLDALKVLKVDILALGMLSCIRRAFEFMEKEYGQQLTIAGICREGPDPSVYRMLQRADSLGVFQVESRAQMSMLPRLRPEKFYDLVIEVAIVRPGPIQGGMVHPYLRRKQGIEPTTYPSPELEEVLGKTLGVPLFQEQAMKIAIVAAGFTPGEADQLRRAMATFRRMGTIGNFKRRFIDGMVSRNYDRAFAERCFSQIEGFGEYGFPESHAASFAILVYVSAWLKCHYPDAFCAAILNAQPMGFYAPAQLVRDAERHGVTVLPPDVNLSEWETSLEPPDYLSQSERSDRPLPMGEEAPGRPQHLRHLHPTHASMEGDIRTTHAVRLGLHRIKGLKEDDAQALVAARGGGYDSVRDLWLRAGLSRAVIERLADGDAFRSLGLDRRDALWAAHELGGGKARDRLPLFDTPEHADIRREPDFALPPMPIGEHIVNDYRYLSLSLKAHPLSFLRDRLAARRIVTSASLRDTADGTRVTVAGLVIIRQRPGTAKGVIFMTLEDETDIANAIVWPKVFERFRPVVLGARLVGVSGRVQSASGVIHVVADKIEDLTPLLLVLSEDAGDLESLARADEVRRPSADNRERPKPRRQHAVRTFDDEIAIIADFVRSTAEPADVMPKGRNFH